MTSFWSIWIIILTSITIVGYSWLLLGNRKSTTGQSTGHAYDGIEELDNPLPAWWFYMFLMTIIWGIGYLIVYPGMGNFKGIAGWTSVNQYEQQIVDAEAEHKALYDSMMAKSIEELASDPQARTMGMRMFGNNCAQCHGADARGAYGFPNLTDNDWIYGGDASTIETTITNGRQAAMPPWGSILGDQGVAEVAAYVGSLSGQEVDTSLVEAGAKHFQSNCSLCHGPEGKGIAAMGAPNLSDDIWLYGGSQGEIIHTIRAGRMGLMPAFKDTLSPQKIHILSAWVYGLRNTQE
ncbi:MAG: cytochrome-c oxidase, cbb3-type subunit III [Parahaliea sp.]